MPATRYKLREQLHFIALDAHQREVVVTIQKWTSPQGMSGVYVKAHNGVEEVRRPYNTELGRLWVQRNFAQARALAAAEPPNNVVALSESAAADEIARRGGPNPTYCFAGDCGAPIPYAASTCPDGHPAERVGSGHHGFGANRRPPVVAPGLKLIQGGKR